MDKGYYDLDKLYETESSITIDMDYFYNYANKELEKNKSSGYCVFISLIFPIGGLILIIIDSFL